MAPLSCSSVKRTMFLILASFIATLFLPTNLAEGIGVGWGRLATQKLLPAAIVDMVLANGMEKVKLFSQNAGVLKAFSRSNISIMLTIPHVDLYFVNNSRSANPWVKTNLTNFIDNDFVNITNVVIGNESLLKVNNRTEFVKDYNKETSYVSGIFPSLKNVQEALNEVNKSYVKVTVSHSTDVLTPVKKPSEADFRDDVKKDILEILSYINTTGAPFNVNLYPIFDIQEKGHPLEYAFFDGNKDYYIKDGNQIYTNVFDEMYDTFVWALKKNGYGNMPITVGQVGWPTDGEIYANISTARRFYSGFLDKIRKNVGTPLRPGPLDVYIHSLVDENSRDIQYRGPVERHYGIYYYDGRPKFDDMDFSGVEGFRRKLEPAQGVMYMPRRWCIVNPNATVHPNDPLSVRNWGWACLKADCSSLFYGASCHGMDYRGNLSYAFNMFFQNRNQNILKQHACDFEGLGMVVEQDPSNGTCKFPLQILSTYFVSWTGEMGATLASTSSGERVHMASGLLIPMPLLLIFFSLLWNWGL